MNETFIGATDDHVRLFQEANREFWKRTNYKPGQNLDMSDPEDRRRAKIWLRIYAEVKAKDHRDRATGHAQRVYNETSFMPYILVVEKPDGSTVHQAFIYHGGRGDLDALYSRVSAHPERFRYLAMFDFTKNTQAPVLDRFSKAAPAAVSGRWY